MSSWGGIFFIAGTSIGAGTLALPMVSCAVGFKQSFLIMVLMACMMVFIGFLNIKLITHHSSSIPVLSKKAFGKTGHSLASLSFLGLHYALLAAYMTGAAQILSSFIPFRYAVILYVLIFGSFLVSRHLDYANRFVFAIKVCVFGSIIALLIPHIKLDCLALHQQNAAWHPLIPIFFTSYGFHGSLFSLVRLTNGDQKKIKTSIIGGTLVTVLFYGLWQMCALGVLQDAKSYSDVSFFLKDICQSVGGKTLLTITPLFSFLAMTTSFLGVGVGLFDYIREVSHQKNTLFCALMTFIPSMVFALFYPNGFIQALEFAAIALSVLAILLPCTIAKFYTKNISFLSFVFFFLTGFSIIMIEILKVFL